MRSLLKTIRYRDLGARHIIGTSIEYQRSNVTPFKLFDKHRVVTVLYLRTPSTLSFETHTNQCPYPEWTKRPSSSRSTVTETIIQVSKRTFSYLSYINFKVSRSRPLRFIQYYVLIYFVTLYWSISSNNVYSNRRCKDDCVFKHYAMLILCVRGSNSRKHQVRYIAGSYYCINIILPIRNTHTPSNRNA